MKAGRQARAATCAAISATATKRGSAMSAIVLQRSISEIPSAQAPKLPMRLSRMISSFCSRVLPPRASAVSASPSSCMAPVSSIVAASVIAAAGNGAALTRMAIQ